MPQSFGTRSERRSFSRRAARKFATTALRQPKAAESLGPKRTSRAERRKQGWRGDISALIHGKHDTAWLYSGTLNASGQQRINAKRNQRAAFWHTVRIRVSTEIEPYFRDSLHLLGKGARIDGRTPLLNWFTVDLDVHIPGAPLDAVTAEPIYRSEHNGDGTYTPVLDHIVWHRADGSLIHVSEETP